MNIPRDDISKIIIHYRQHGRNFVLYVLGINASGGSCEELSSSYYSDLNILQIEARSIKRFIRSLGFEEVKELITPQTEEAQFFERLMNT